MRTRGWGVLAACVCAGCSDGDPMNAQARDEPYGHSAFFADGRAMRPLVPDTVPQEWRRRVAPGPGGETGRLPDGSWAQRVPLPLTPALLDEGRVRFEAFCAVCHGLDGSGESAVAEKMPMRRPPSLVGPHEHAREVPRGEGEEALASEAEAAQGSDEAMPGGALAAKAARGPNTARAPEGAAARGSAEASAPDGATARSPVRAPPAEGAAASGPLGAWAPAVVAAREVAGEGDGGVSLTGGSLEPAAAGDLPHPPGYYFTVISEGYGVMPSYGLELEPRERWAVVAWLRVLARSQRSPLDAAPPEVRRQLLQMPSGEGSP
ncbi:c-type cytochrome [Myxococcaceae bacterium GXIMD 01537]